MACPGLACRPANGRCSLSACVRDGSQLQCTPLQSALENDDLKTARWLVEQGADMESRDSVRLGRGFRLGMPALEHTSAVRCPSEFPRAPPIDAAVSRRRLKCIAVWPHPDRALVHLPENCTCSAAAGAGSSAGRQLLPSRREALHSRQQARTVRTGPMVLQGSRPRCRRIGSATTGLPCLPMPAGLERRTLRLRSCIGLPRSKETKCSSCSYGTELILMCAMR